MIEFESILKNTKAYKTIMQDKHNSSLNHCIMLLSEDEIACNNLARILARDLICQTDGCGKCKDCVMLENMAHPALVLPLDLKAAGIRDFISRCYYVTEGDKKIALIQNFQDIEFREQNRLLKLLEEPAQNTIFIISATKPSGVLETIKSRAFKFVIEPFNSEELYKELCKNFDESDVEKAVEFSEGSLTSAKNILDNETFIECYDTIVDILDNLKASGFVLAALSKIKLSQKDYSSRVKSALNYLDAFELILKQLLEINTNIATSSDDRLNRIAKDYNAATIVNVESLIIDAKKKISNRCDADGVFYSLFMKMMEVKYKCQ